MNAEIIALAKQFRLYSLGSGKSVVERENEQFLLGLLRAEAAMRDEKAIAERLKQAHLPTFKDFDGFDCDFQRGISISQLQTLAKLDWIEQMFNLILIGPPGTGKTHIALAIGNKAARCGYKVFFSSMDNIVHILKTQEISRKSASRMSWIKKCDLVIIDEMGYLPVSKVEANLFFGLISQLYENASVIITSNKGFDGWAELFGDAILTTALLDRLTHRCQVLSFSDESFRLANRKQLF